MNCWTCNATKAERQATSSGRTAHHYCARCWGNASNNREQMAADTYQRHYSAFRTAPADQAVQQGPMPVTTWAGTDAKHWRVK